jgi:4-amino-4-deoxy-L-arabinose transferase-like glycosyltransferase
MQDNPLDLTPNAAQKALRLTFHVSRVDLRNLALLLLGFVCLLVILPPARIYPVGDDWSYSQSVSDLLNWAYKPHDWPQAISLGHLAWGALFSSVFGESFTVLTISNLVMSAICLLVFYLLLRDLHVSPGSALLGVAVLGLNPIYLYLSYSFMTDITFLTYLLGACLCYLRGIRDGRVGWLLGGSVAAALAYLTRQYGILVMPVALGYLWWVRRWTWRRVIVITAIPVAAAILYALWQRGQPAPLIALQMAQYGGKITTHLGEFVLWRAQRIAWLLPGLGLSLLPCLRLPRRNWLLVSFLGFVLFCGLQGAYAAEGPFSVNGNIIDDTGSLMYYYVAAAIWSSQIWSLLALVGVVNFCLYGAALLEQMWRWLCARPWRGPNRLENPALFLYALGLPLAAVVVLLTPFVFDRYWLVILPILILPALRTSAEYRVLSAEWPVHTRHSPLATRHSSLVLGRWLALVPIALFALLGQRDYISHAAARWQGAQSLVAQGVDPKHIKAGYEWDDWYSFQEGARFIRATNDLTHIDYPPDAVKDPVYRVADLPFDGYTQVGSLPYKSLLEGGITRHVLLLKRQ